MTRGGCDLHHGEGQPHDEIALEREHDQNGEEIRAFLLCFCRSVQSGFSALLVR